ncbi:MAG TPA: IS110 family transposase [Stellaceae bacterium]|nr:IS110 family transposase [Stellaceae bacterium]
MSTSQPLETNVAKPSVTLYVTFELGKWAWLVGLFAPELGKGTSRHKIAGGDLKRVMELVATARARLEQPQRTVRIVSIYEAGYEGAWLHRALLAAGIESRVIDAASMAVDRRARRVKTDRLDLERLMRELLALERGERSGVCRVVRVPSAAEEDAKEQHRQRDFLVRQRTALVNRMSGLLMARGVRGLSPRRPDFLPKMQAALAGDGQPLLPGLQRALTFDYQRLQLIEQQIATIEAEQAKELKAVDGLPPYGAAAEASAANAARLAKLKGIGPIGGLVLSREVFYRHFDNRRQLASYFGLTPSPYYSGGSRTDQGISRAGNARARAIAVELAWFWLHHQPASSLSCWFRDYVGYHRGRVRRIAIIALARKLMIALWRYLTTGLVPEGAVLKAA